MKPKNRVMCPDCNKPKMLFDTERKANDFIKWNGDEIDTHGGVLRPYYCPACCGWHITHKKYSNEYVGRTDNLINAFSRSMKKGNKIDHLIHSFDYESDARRIFSELPGHIQNTDMKGVLKRYLTDYFFEHDIEDNGGNIRREIYKLWE